MRLSWLGSIAWLTVVWLLLWGEVNAFLIVTGALAAAFVLLVFPLPRLDRQPLVAPWATLVLIGVFLRDLTVASVHVAWLAVRPGRPVTGTVIAIPLRCEDDLLQTITAEMVALVPGTVVLDLDGTTGLLTFHALDVQTPEQIEAAGRAVLAQERRVALALGSAGEIARVEGMARWPS